MTLNAIWSMDFVADALFDGRKLAVVDLYTRECLAIEVGQSLKGEDGVRVLSAVAQHGARMVKSDHGLLASISTRNTHRAKKPRLCGID